MYVACLLFQALAGPCSWCRCSSVSTTTWSLPIHCIISSPRLLPICRGLSVESGPLKVGRVVLLELNALYKHIYTLHNIKDFLDKIFLSVLQNLHDIFFKVLQIWHLKAFILHVIEWPRIKMLDISYNIGIRSKFKHCIQLTFNTWSYMLFTGNRTNFTLIVSVARRFCAGNTVRYSLFRFI